MGEVDEILISSDRIQMILGFEGSPNESNIILYKEPSSPLVGQWQNAGLTIKTAQV